MGGTVSSRFFWTDWLSDAGLRRSSLAARGLWMDMLCIAAEHSPRGYVAVNGTGLTADELAGMCGTDLGTAKNLIEELERNGVFARRRDGTIYSRRMIRDEKNREIGRKNGKLGGNPSLSKTKGNSSADNQKVKGSHKGEGSPLASTSSVSKDSEQASRPVAGGALAVCRRAVTEAFLAAQARSPEAPQILPDTARVEVWAAQGFDLVICAAVVVDGLSRKPSISTLKYFDGAIKDAHEKRVKSNGSAERKSAEPKEVLWRRQWDWWRRTGEWPGVWGASPDASHGCEIPKELIERWSAET